MSQLSNDIFDDFEIEKIQNEIIDFYSQEDTRRETHQNRKVKEMIRYVLSDLNWVVNINDGGDESEMAVTSQSGTVQKDKVDEYLLPFPMPMKINGKQYEAICSEFHRPLLIEAGPGSGKTMTLACRVAYMLSSGISPNEILTLTFTRKAAKELKERISKLLITCDHISHYGFTTCTFHRFCLKILKNYASFLDPNIRKFRINNTKTQMDILESCLDDWVSHEQCLIATGKRNGYHFEVPKDKYDKKKVLKDLLSAIGKIKANDWALDFIHNELLEFIFPIYNQKVKESGAIDMNDIIPETVNLFLKHSEILQKYQRIYKYILCDEFQDTTSIQWKLITTLAGNSLNITSVGDSDQSIYGFRGTSLQNFDDFLNLGKSDVQLARIVNLTQNYRSTQNIISTSTKVISQLRIKASMWTKNEDGAKVNFIKSKSIDHEIVQILDLIDRYVSNGHKYCDVAILYRNRWIGKKFEPELRKRKIRFGLNGQISYQYRQEVITIVAYANLILSSTDNNSFMKIYNTPNRDISPNIISYIQSVSEENGKSYFTNAQILSASSSDGLRPLKAFISMIQKFKTELSENKYNSIYEFMDTIIKRTKYKSFMNFSQEIEIENAFENEFHTDDHLRILIRESRNFEKEFIRCYGNQYSFVDKVRSFLEQISVDQEGTEENELTLTTMHQAKGLEWPIVIIVHVNEGFIPASAYPSTINFCGNSSALLAEERRIFYVGMTRAQKILVLSSIENKSMIPSSFLTDIPEGLLQDITSDDHNKGKSSVEIKIFSGKKKQNMEITKVVPRFLTTTPKKKSKDKKRKKQFKNKKLRKKQRLT